MSVNILHFKSKSIHLSLSRPLLRLNLGLIFVFDTLDEQFITNQMSTFTFATKLQHFGDTRLTDLGIFSVTLKWGGGGGGVFQITLQGYLSKVLFILSANKLQVLLRVLNFED